jgi:hypothetical protein
LTHEMNRYVPEGESCPNCGGSVVYWLPDGIGIADVPSKLKAATTVDGGPAALSDKSGAPEGPSSTI